MKKILALSAAALLLTSPAMAATMHHHHKMADTTEAATSDDSADQLNAQVNAEAVGTAKDAMAHGTMTTDHTANMMARDGMAPPPPPMHGGMMTNGRMMSNDHMDDGDHMLHAPAGM